MAVQPAIAFFTLFFWWSTFGFVALELSLQPPEPGGTFSVDKKSYEGLEKAKGEPYEIFAPDTLNRSVLVSSPKYFNEMDHAPDSVLSLQAAFKQMLHPK